MGGYPAHATITYLGSGSLSHKLGKLLSHNSAGLFCVSHVLSAGGDASLSDERRHSRSRSTRDAARVQVV